MKPLRAIALVLSIMMSFAACGTDEPSGGAGNADLSQLQFTAKTLDGAEFSGEELAGKPAVMWFWTPWCAICQSEAGFIADMAEAHSSTDPATPPTRSSTPRAWSSNG